MKASFGQRCLVFYSGALTLAVCVALLSGFADLHGPRFDTITVQRINIVEPDGTLRMVISDNSRIPGIVMHGKEYPDFNSRKASTAAGILFYDAEGSESGGLTFGGAQRRARYHHSLRTPGLRPLRTRSNVHDRCCRRW